MRDGLIGVTPYLRAGCFIMRFVIIGIGELVQYNGFAGSRFFFSVIAAFLNAFQQCYPGAEGFHGKRSFTG